MKTSKLLCVELFLCTLIGCTEKESTMSVSSVSLNTATIEMVEGETFSLVATVLPKDAEYDGVMWASSNASVASVNSGTVTAVKEGTATITASAGGKSSTCTVKVSAKVVTVTSITLDKTSLSMQVGETETITATVNPDNASDKSVVWGSSDVSVATVSDGTITAKKSGEAIISAKSGSCIAKCKVTITVSTESITLDKTSLSLVVGETAQLTATVKPDDATDKNVAWASSDESVAKVSNGKVTAVKSGKATITAKCGDKIAECAVTVTVPTGSVTLDKTTLSLAVGETEQLTATVKPDDATDKNVTWTSSDESVAKVVNGKVTAVKSGKATITAKCGGKTAECAVTVTVPTGSVTLDKTSLSLAVGETAQLAATVKPDDATDKNVSWTSSDESVAKVDNGKVTAIKAGKATIIAKCGGKTAECAVTVTVPTGSVTLDKTTLSLAIGETATLTATVKPDDATDKNVAWASSDESVAKVANGKVTAVKAGKATITAKCGGKTAECAVTVTVPTGSVTLDKTSLSLAVGETAQLTATVSPDDATDKNVSWTSSDELIAKVENGKVMAIKSGKATITAKCGDKTAKCVVTVIVPVSSVTLDRNDLMLPVGYAATLTATVKPDNATDKNVKWSSSDESVAIVNNGNITTVKEGEAIISVSVGNLSSSCKVVVINSNRVIKYTAGSIVTPLNEDAFGAKIISNEYSYPNGMILFDGPVTKIGRNAFYKCQSLWTIIIPEQVSDIGDNAFYYCEKLNSVSLPNNLSSIGESAFYECRSLASIDLPTSLTTIEKETFAHCISLSNVPIPKNLKTIGAKAFYFTRLQTLDLPEGLQSIGESAFYENDYITKITIPSSVILLGNSAFSSCSSLTFVDIQGALTTLSTGCFMNCDLLSTVVLPDSITKFEAYVFYGCPVLTDLYIKAINPPQILTNMYGSFDSNMAANIWVPRASVDTYKAKWAEFKDNIKAYDF